MRLHIKINANKSIVSFDHIPQLVGTIHKWIGEQNDYHGSTSMYSFSWLQGGRKGNGGLYFPKGASFFISTFDEILLKQIIHGIREEPSLFAGMDVQEIRIQQTPCFSGGSECFNVASPVLVKVKEGERVKHCLYDDPESSEALTQSMVRKLELAGIDSVGLSIAFDQEYRSAHTKLINYKGVKNRANVCPVLVKGSNEQIGFIWNVGIGHSTGIGFGALN
ncbi:MAG: CRISPR-associated endoribonuclease Cas6 [Cytophagales bacterium]|uniref:CRISPR-associated endoribonuclease Cas6 n=1 Tax=Cyclobacterium marinum TaxID=104 RepID=UPI0030D96FED|nr:CRISPR-associated endoribonuclease Cas6 [Cytophagales bacterium]|tara:strand:+ start:10847 stop:11509 length:663 start_codon:yes stop_codon:yes gene_type:complete